MDANDYLNILPNAGRVTSVDVVAYKFGPPHVRITDEHGNSIVLSKDVVEFAAAKLKELEKAEHQGGRAE